MVSFDDSKKVVFQSQVSALSDRDPTLGTSLDDGTSSNIIPGTTATTTTTTTVSSCLSQGSMKEEDRVTKRPSLESSTTTVSCKTSVTFGGQMDLKPLPIPSLDVTLERFIQSIQALDDNPEQTKMIIDEFLKNDGPKLQELLIDYDRIGRERGEIGSYVEEFWNDSYLAPDSSVVLNLNPYFVLVRRRGIHACMMWEELPKSDMNMCIPN